MINFYRSLSENEKKGYIIKQMNSFYVRLISNVSIYMAGETLILNASTYRKDKNQGINIK